MTDRALKPIVELVRRSRPRHVEPTALATVTDVSSTGVLVRFDEDAAATSKRYRSIVGASVGDRVLMVRVARTWVCAGTVRQGPGVQGSNQQVLTTNGSGVGTVTYPEPYFASPAVVATPRNNFRTISDLVPTATSFTFVARDGTGALVVSSSITITWLAHPATS